MQALENPDGDGNASSNGPNVLDKERNLMNEDPKWQGMYVTCPKIYEQENLKCTLSSLKKFIKTTIFFSPFRSR